MKALLIAIFGCILLGLALYFHYYYKSEKEGFQQHTMGNIIETDIFLNSSQLPTPYQMNGNYIYHTIQTEHLNFVFNIDNYKYVKYPESNVVVWTVPKQRVLWSEYCPDSRTWGSPRFSERTRFGSRFNVYITDLKNYISNYFILLRGTGDNFTNKLEKLNLMSAWDGFNTENNNTPLLQSVGVPNNRRYHFIDGHCDFRFSRRPPPNAGTSYIGTAGEIFTLANNGREEIAYSGGIPGPYGAIDDAFTLYEEQSRETGEYVRKTAKDVYNKLKSRLLNSISVSAAINEKLILNVYGNITQRHVDDFYTSLKLGVLFDFSDANKIFQYFRVPYNSENLDGKTMLYSYGKFFRDVKIVSATERFNYTPDENAIRYNDIIKSFVDPVNIRIPNTFDSNAILNNTYTITRTIPSATAGIEDKFVGTLDRTLLALLPQTARRNITSVAYNQTARIIEQRLDDFNVVREIWQPSCGLATTIFGPIYYFRDGANRTPYERNRLVPWRDNTEIDPVSQRCGKVYRDTNNQLTDIEKLTQWNFEYAGTLPISYSNIKKANMLIQQASNNNFRTFLYTTSRTMPEGQNKIFKDFYQGEPSGTDYPIHLINDMLLNYKQNLAKLVPDYGGELKILNPSILNKIAQSFYEYSDGLFEISYIYEVLRVGSNMLDIRFDKKQRLPPNEFIKLRSQYNITIETYNSVLDMINQGTWVTKYSSYDDAQNDLSTITTRLDPVFNPIYPIGGIGTLQSLNASLQANKVTMNTLSNQLDVMINETQTGLRNTNSNISSLVTTAPQVITDISRLQQNYNSTLESEYRITNLINGITTSVARVFYTNNPFRVDGLALGIHAALSYNKAYNGNLDIDIGNSPGNVNYAPTIEYTKNVTPAIVCSNVDFMNRIAQAYTDNIYNSLSTLSSNVFLSNAGEVKIDKITGFKQINNTTCGYTWQETEYDYYTNQPKVRRLVNVVLPFKFDNSVYQQPELLIDNNLANGLQVTYLSNIPLNRQNLDNSNLSNLNTRLTSLRTELSNYLGSNLPRFNIAKSLHIVQNDFIGSFSRTERGYEVLQEIPQPFYRDIYNSLQRGERNIGLAYFSTIDNYITLNKLLTFIDGYLLNGDRRYYRTYNESVLKGSANVINILDNKNFFDNFIEKSNYFVKLISKTVQEIDNLRSFTPVTQRPGTNTYTFGTLDDTATKTINKLITYNSKLIFSNDRTGLYNLFNDMANRENYYRGYFSPEQETAYRRPQENEPWRNTGRYFITYKYFFDNLNEFRGANSEMNKYTSNLVYQSNRVVPIKRILSDIENTLDNAGGACQPTYTCKSPEIMRQLLDQYNVDDSNSDTILRVMNAFTVSPYQCDYLVENRNRSGVAFSTTTVSKSFQVGVDFKECYYFIANYGLNNTGYYVSENQTPPIVRDSSDTDLSGFQYIGGVLYDYYNSVSNTITPYVQKARQLTPRLFNALSNIRTETYGSMSMLNIIKVNENPAYDFFGFINLLSNSTKLKYLFFSSYPFLTSRIKRLIKIGIINSNTFDCLYEAEDINYDTANNRVVTGTLFTQASRFTISATPTFNDYSFTYMYNVNPSVFSIQISSRTDSPPLLQTNTNYLLSNTVNIVNDYNTLINIQPLDKRVRELLFYSYKNGIRRSSLDTLRIELLSWNSGTINRGKIIAGILNYKKISADSIVYKLKVINYNGHVPYGDPPPRPGFRNDLLNNPYAYYDPIYDFEGHVFVRTRFAKNNIHSHSYYVLENTPLASDSFTNPDINILLTPPGTNFFSISPCPSIDFNNTYIRNLTNIQYLANPITNIRVMPFDDNPSICEYYIPTTDNVPYGKRFIMVAFYNDGTTCTDYNNIKIQSIYPQNPTESRFGVGYQSIDIQTLVNTFKTYYNSNMTGDKLNLEYDAKIGKVHEYYRYMNQYVFKASVFYYNKNNSNYFLSKVPDAEIFNRYKYYGIYFFRDIISTDTTLSVISMTELSFDPSRLNNISINESRTFPLAASNFSNITDTSALNTPDRNYFMDNFRYTSYRIVLTDSYLFYYHWSSRIRSERYKSLINQIAQISFYKNSEEVDNIITTNLTNVRNMDFTLNPTIPFITISTRAALSNPQILVCKYEYTTNFDVPLSINGYSFICGSNVSKIVKDMEIIIRIGSDEFTLPAFRNFTYSDTNGYRYPHSYFRTPVFYMDGTSNILPQTSLYRFNLTDCDSLLDPLATHYTSYFRNTSNLLNLLSNQIYTLFRNSANHVELSNINLSHYKVLENSIQYAFNLNYTFFDYMIDTSNIYYNSNIYNTYFIYETTFPETFANCTNIPYTGPSYYNTVTSIDNTFTETSNIINLSNIIQYFTNTNLKYKVDYLSNCPNNSLNPLSDRVLQYFTNSNVQLILNNMFSNCPVAVEISNISVKYVRTIEEENNKGYGYILEASCTDLVRYDNGYDIPINFNRPLVVYNSNSYKMLVHVDLPFNRITMDCTDFRVSPPRFVSHLEITDILINFLSINYNLTNNNLTVELNLDNKPVFPRELYVDLGTFNTIVSSNVFYYNPVSNIELESCFYDDQVLNEMNSLYTSNTGFPLDAIQYKTYKTDNLHQCIFKLRNNTNIGIGQSNRRATSIDRESVFVINNSNFKQPFYDTFNYIRFTPLSTRNGGTTFQLNKLYFFTYTGFDVNAGIEIYRTIQLSDNSIIDNVYYNGTMMGRNNFKNLLNKDYNADLYDTILSPITVKLKTPINSLRYMFINGALDSSPDNDITSWRIETSKNNILWQEVDFQSNVDYGESRLTLVNTEFAGDQFFVGNLYTVLEYYADIDGNPLSVPFIQDTQFFTAETYEITEYALNFSLNVFKSLVSTSNLYLYSYFPILSNNTVFYIALEYGTSNYAAFGLEFKNAPYNLVTQYITNTIPIQNANNYVDYTTFINRVLFYNNTTPYILNSPTGFVNSNMEGSWISNNYPNLSNFTYFWDYNDFIIINPQDEIAFNAEQNEEAAAEAAAIAAQEAADAAAIAAQEAADAARIAREGADSVAAELALRAQQEADALAGVAEEALRNARLAEEEASRESLAEANADLTIDALYGVTSNERGVINSIGNTERTRLMASNPNSPPYLVNRLVRMARIAAANTMYAGHPPNIVTAAATFATSNLMDTGDETVTLASTAEYAENQSISNTGSEILTNYATDIYDSTYAAALANGDTDTAAAAAANAARSNMYFVAGTAATAARSRLSTSTNALKNNAARVARIGAAYAIRNRCSAAIAAQAADTAVTVIYETNGSNPDGAIAQAVSLASTCLAETFTNYNPYSYYKNFIFENDKNVKPIDIKLYDKHNNELKTHTIMNNGKILVELYEKRLVYGYSFINTGIMKWRLYGLISGKKPILLDARSSKKQLQHNFQMPLFRLDGKVIELPQISSKKSTRDGKEIVCIDKETFVKYYKQYVNNSIQPTFKKRLIDKDIYYLMYDEYDLNKNLIRKNMIIGMKVKNNKVIDVIYYEDDDGNRDAFNLSKKEVKYFWNTKIGLPLTFEEF